MTDFKTGCDQNHLCTCDPVRKLTSRFSQFIATINILFGRSNSVPIWASLAHPVPDLTNPPAEPEIHNIWWPWTHSKKHSTSQMSIHEEPGEVDGISFGGRQQQCNSEGRTQWCCRQAEWAPNICKDCLSWEEGRGHTWLNGVWNVIINWLPRLLELPPGSIY